MTNQSSDNGVLRQKFHPLFGLGLSVALQSMLTLRIGELSGNVKDTIINIKPPEMVHINNKEGPAFGDVKIYYPASGSADMRNLKSGTLNFLPWLDEVNIGLESRLILFRLRPQKGPHWIRFGRHERNDFDEKPFSFKFVPNGVAQNREQIGFLPLDFYSKRGEEEGGFLPLYLKVQNGLRDFKYLLIEGEINEGGPTLKVRHALEGESPKLLVKELPMRV